MFAQGTDDARFAVEHKDQSVSQFQGGGQGLGKAFSRCPAPDGEAVNDDFDIVGLVTVYLLAGAEVFDIPIHAHLGVTLFEDLFKQLAVMSFTPPDDRGQEQDFSRLELFADEVAHLFLCIAFHALPAEVGVRFPYAGEEQAQEVEDLRYRADR